MAWRAKEDHPPTPPLRCAVRGDGCQAPKWNWPWREDTQGKCALCGAEVCYVVTCSRVIVLIPGSGWGGQPAQRLRSRVCVPCADARARTA